ncbi:MAG: winged helix-turn-helix domain-containing protein [Candidatus Heimdallarchaeota archaeon]
MTSNFSVQVKIWLEKGSKSILGPGRMAILEAIERTGSLTSATEECQISFRKAWKLINEINELLDQPVVKSERGGKGGGGNTVLTDYGKKLVRQYKFIQEKITELTMDPDIWAILKS